MKIKKIAIFMLVLGILLIVLGTSISIYKEVSSKKYEQEKTEKKIISEHESFRKKVDAFNEIRSVYYSEVVDNLFLKTVESDYKDWITILDNYTSKVDEVEETSSYLKEECVNKYYSNKDITNKCDSFVIAYETVINYYTKDIIDFNEVLKEYRRENDVDEEESEIKDYVSKYNYVDINLDGEFIGKK